MFDIICYCGILCSGFSEIMTFRVKWRNHKVTPLNPGAAPE